MMTRSDTGGWAPGSDTGGWLPHSVGGGFRDSTGGMRHMGGW
ncbi:hypothetical protein [Nonomuraea sp. NPDC050202]